MEALHNIPLISEILTAMNYFLHQILMYSLRSASIVYRLMDVAFMFFFMIHCYFKKSNIYNSWAIAHFSR